MKSKRLLIGLCLVFILLTSATCGKKGPPTVTKIDDCRLSVEERGLKDKRNDNDKFQLSNVKLNSNVQMANGMGVTVKGFSRYFR